MFWKLLFWLYSLFYVLLIILTSREIRWNFVDWLGDVAILTGLFLFYAYAYKKNYFSKSTRSLIVFTAIAYWLVYVFYLDQKYGAYPGAGLGDAIFNIIMVLPVYIPATLYARRDIN